MKFAAVLFLAAVATVSAEASKPLTPASFPYNSSGSSDVDCPAFCFAVMRPVYDTNGVQYSNECEMRRAKCQGKEKRKSMEEIYADYKSATGSSRSVLTRTARGVIAALLLVVTALSSALTSTILFTTSKATHTRMNAT